MAESKGDQFIYKYVYDAENRLRETWTGRDENEQWNLDARYSYYLHGPLARVELGHNNVQGIDYAYTLNGWLKAINGDEVSPGQDMGKDGNSGSSTDKFSRDEIAFTLGYFNGDYKSIAENGNAITRNYVPQTVPPGTPFSGTGAPLFNGNISNITLHLAPEVLGAAKGYTYRYDQLNRLLSVRQHSNLASGTNSTWNNNSITQNFKEDLTYDANGNILSYLRNGSLPSELVMDNLTYHYNRNDKGDLLNNKLNYVHDAIPASSYTEDIESQTPGNFVYDKIGNLIADNDAQQKIQSVKWNVYGKISSITKETGAVIKYDYDATGNRIWKNLDNNEKSTFYVRDPQGNVIAVYEYDAAAGGGAPLVLVTFRTWRWNPSMVLVV